MELTFTVSERESLALTEQFYKDSPLHQRARNRTRWTLPLILLPILVVFIAQFGFAVLPTTVFLLGAVGWFLLSPKLFDARVKRYAKQQMRESSYAKSLGDYRIQIDDTKLVSEGPTGYTEYRWDAVDRVVLTEEFLFIFLSGPMGLVISIKQVGTERAKVAYDAIRHAIQQAG